MLLVPFREQPFAKKIDLEALAKEILADPDLAPIQKYDPKDFTKKMASEVIIIQIIITILTDISR